MFDIFDLDRLEAEGSLLNAIVHEMGHVLGIGTLWRFKGLVRNLGSANPVFIGPQAQSAFAEVIGQRSPLPVPVENRGGPGTAGGHWRDLVFANELMTGFLNPGSNPLSKLTIASLADLGYEVDFGAGDSFEFVTSLQMAVMGITATDNQQRCATFSQFAQATDIGHMILPETAVAE